MKIAVYLTPAQVRAVQAVFIHSNGSSNTMETDIGEAAKRALNAFNERVRQAENLLARVRDSDNE